MFGRISPFVILLAIFALIDFLAMPFVTWVFHVGGLAPWLIDGGLGVFLAQFGVLPAWLVWGCRPFWQRLALHWGSAAGLWLAVVLGFLCSEPYPIRIDGDFFAVALVLPTLSLAIEGPLWLTRWFFGWRLVPPGAAAAPEKKPAVRDFLVGMSVVAMALTAARWALSLSNARDEASFWMAIAIPVVSAALVSAAALPLMAWALLGLDNWRRGLAIVGIYGLAVYCLLTGIIALLLLGTMNSLEPFAVLLLFQGVFVAVIAASYLLARRAGYRLQVGPSGPPLGGKTKTPRDVGGP